MTCLSSKHALSRFPALGRSVFVLAFVALAVGFLVPRGAGAARLFTSGFETDNFTQTEWSAFGAGSPVVVNTPIRSGSYGLKISASVAETVYRPV